MTGVENPSGSIARKLGIAVMTDQLLILVSSRSNSMGLVHLATVRREAPIRRYWRHSGHAASVARVSMRRE